MALLFRGLRRGGAGHVTTVDLAPMAVQFAERNWELNGLDAGAHDAQVRRGGRGGGWGRTLAVRRATRNWGLSSLDAGAHDAQVRRGGGAVTECEGRARWWRCDFAERNRKLNGLYADCG